MPLCPRQRIVITGGTGHLGQILARHFYECGHAVTVVGRHPRSFEWDSATWDGVELSDWTQLIEGAEVVINLAGRSVRCRHTAAHRREIKNSRILSTQMVGQAIARAQRPPRVWLNASTATIYRHSLHTAMDEATGELGGGEPGALEKWRFSVDVATSWERALFAPNTPKTRRVAMRMGAVMSPDNSGAFAQLMALVRMGLGGSAATGRQFVSWIHDVDFVRAVEFLIAREDFDGPVNVCSPRPLPNRDFMRCLRQSWCTTYIGLPAPRWLLAVGALLVGSETELLLKSRRVIPRRLLEGGFDFHFPNWRSASQDLVCRWRECYAAEHVSAEAL